MARPGREAGYALLAVLWICVGVGGLTLVLSEAGRSAVASSRNRIALTRASWNGAGCLAYARAGLADLLIEENRARSGALSRTWNRLDSVLASVRPPAAYACRIVAYPVGSRLDVNATDRATLLRLFVVMGIPAGRADSAAAAIVSARAFARLEDLRLVPAVESLLPLEGVLDVEPGPISINHAPPQLLALLPGFTAELVERVVDARGRGAFVESFLGLSEGLSSEARDSLARRSARLPGVAVLEATAWVLTMRSTAGNPPVTAVLEARLGRAGVRTVIARRRSWIQ